jgi:hypothetical protein
MADLVTDYPEDVAAFQPWSQQRTLDREGLARIHKSLAETRDDLEEAERENDVVEAGHCREEIQNLQVQLKHAVGLGGKPRDLNQDDKLRPMVYGTLTTAYKKLRDANPTMSEVADHFEASISSESGAFVYFPAQSAPAWVTGN